MTNEEINNYYSSSLLIWNAYNRSTQSGVLAKAFMFGTPAIVMKKNLSEFVVDGREIRAVEDNNDFNELLIVTEDLIQNIIHYSHEARKNFKRNYYYRNYNNNIKYILKQMGLNN